MLPALLENVLTPCPRSIRALGYLRELLNIRKLHRRWAVEWKPHLEQTQAILRTAMGRCQQKRKAVIFGSGWWHDVPVAELAATFREVILVDIVQPYSIRRRAHRFTNVRLVTADVTGVADAVYRAVRSRGSPLPLSEPNLFVGDDEVDLAASVMLLSQVHHMPEQFLLKAGKHPPDEIATFAGQVILAHLKYLQRLSGVVSLVTDVRNDTLSETGHVIRHFGLLRGVVLHAPDVTWTWPLTPRGLRAPHHAHHRHVVGIVDLKNAVGR